MNSEHRSEREEFEADKRRALAEYQRKERQAHAEYDADMKTATERYQERVKSRRQSTPAPTGPRGGPQTKMDALRSR